MKKNPFSSKKPTDLSAFYKEADLTVVNTNLIRFITAADRARLSDSQLEELISSYLSLCDSVVISGSLDFINKSHLLPGSLQLVESSGKLILKRC